MGLKGKKGQVVTFSLVSSPVKGGHPRDHESGEQEGISLKNFGLYHVTKIIATVTTPPY